MYCYMHIVISFGLLVLLCFGFAPESTFQHTRITIIVPRIIVKIGCDSILGVFDLTMIYIAVYLGAGCETFDVQIGVVQDVMAAVFEFKLNLPLLRPTKRIWPINPRLQLIIAVEFVFLVWTL